MFHCALSFDILIFSFFCSYFAFVPETSKTFKRVTSQRFLKGQKISERTEIQGDQR